MPKPHKQALAAQRPAPPDPLLQLWQGHLGGITEGRARHGHRSSLFQLCLLALQSCGEARYLALHLPDGSCQLVPLAGRRRLLLLL